MQALNGRIIARLPLNGPPLTWNFSKRRCRRKELIGVGEGEGPPDHPPFPRQSHLASGGTTWGGSTTGILTSWTVGPPASASTTLMEMMGTAGK